MLPSLNIHLPSQKVKFFKQNLSPSPFFFNYLSVAKGEDEVKLHRF